MEEWRILLGAESFFIKFLENAAYKQSNSNEFGDYDFTGATTHTDAEAVYLLANASKYFNKKKLLKQSKIKIKGQLFFSIHSHDGYFQGFTFEGCFSYYEECIELIKNLFSKIAPNFPELCIYDPNSNSKIKINNADDIQNYILAKFNKKYENFKNIFGNIHIKSLPDNAFYKKYRLHKLFPFFVRCGRMEENEK